MMIWILLIVLPLTIEGKQTCPGGTDTCPDLSTCCQTLDKSYGCCPLKDAVCCEDHIHCCPSGHKCSAGMCVLSTNLTTEATLVVNKDVVCPDPTKNVSCPDLTTCCLNPDTGSYNCCPMEDAVCCSDGYHCCPSGTTCNVEEQRCNGDGYIAKLYGTHAKYAKHGLVSTTKKMSILRVSDKLKNIICPGSGFQCPDYSTCCKLPSGNWGCCPFPNGFCCKDGIHCCPEHMHCDETSQYCSQGPNGNNITSLRSKPAKKLEMITCPDKKICTNAETCCLLYNTTYVCCPYPNATCCSDRLTCCPENTQCDGGIPPERCVPKSLASTTKKMSILRVGDKLKNIICPGSGFQCPDYNTCCKLPSGNWGCCPFPKGFCCKDGIHCCPEHMHCDETSQYCSQGPNGNNITSLHSKPAKKLELNICPDKKTCQDFETCCKISDTSYGCCPYANATCCQDRKHCCPGDSQCDETGGRCIPKVLNKFGF